MSTAELPTIHIEVAFNPESDTQESYETLLNNAKVLASTVGVSYEIYDPTLRLLEQLKDYDEKTAYECLQDLPLALTVVDTIGGFYGMDVTEHKRFVWSAILVHDVGKTKTRKELLDKSNKGDEWTDEDMAEISEHATKGARLAQEAGLPFEVCRAIAEHHGKQLSRLEYGDYPELDFVSRIVRDGLVIADFMGAMLMRNNSRNRNMSREERLNEVKQDIGYVLNDYNGASDLSEFLYHRLASLAA
jgi:putative nucleotidyltransferase with HDIG domain